MKKEYYVTPQATKVEFGYEEHVVASGNDNCLIGTLLNNDFGSGGCKYEYVYQNN